MTFSCAPRRPVAALAALLAAGALAGCGNGLDSTTGAADAPSTSAPASSSPTAGTSTSAASSPSASPSDAGTSESATPSSGSDQVPPPTRRLAPCDNAQLDIGLSEPSGGAAAGSVYVLLTFENTDSATCTMSGHPGVSFVGKGNGTQLGTSADRYGSVRTITLRSGESTHAVVKIARAGNFDADDCAPTTSDGFRVYPPDSRASVYVPYETEACQGDLGRGHSQLQVSAVGQAS